MHYDSTHSKYSQTNQDHIPQDPGVRETQETISFDEIRIEVILTAEQVADMKGEFPYERRGTREINGEVVEVIENLYRIDVLGNKVRNDDIAGFSWTDKQRINPIPRYLRYKCANPWDRHGIRVVYLFEDGEPVGKNNVVLCTECVEYLNNAPWWRKLLGRFGPFKLTPE